MMSKNAKRLNSIHNTATFRTSLITLVNLSLKFKAARNR